MTTDSHGHLGEMPSYFICYSRDDLEVVRKIHEEIEKWSPKYRVWRDERNLKAGERIDSTIQKAIDTCRAILFVVTKNSVKSDYCLDELDRGFEKKKMIVPLLLDFDAERPFRLGRCQWINFSESFEAGLKSLCNFLEQGQGEGQPASVTAEPVVINDPPLRVTAHFVGRDKEYQDIEEFISGDASALLWVWGRGGSGKTTLVCRVLEQVQRGSWVILERKVPILAVAYLNREHQSERGWFNLLDQIRSLIPPIPRLQTQDRHLTSAVEDVLSALSDRRVVLLIDHVDDLIDLNTGDLADPNLRDALRSISTVTTHKLRVIVTSCILPSSSIMAHQDNFPDCNLKQGLPQWEAVKLLRESDRDGSLGLRDGEENLLGKIVLRTQGNPRAIKALYTKLKKDLDASPKNILHALHDKKSVLSKVALAALIGESYACLDDVSKVVMQILSVCEHPVTTDAVSSIFHHYYPEIDSHQVLSRLVNLQLVENIEGCYILREADRFYMASQLVDDAVVTDGCLDRSTLHKRWANYLKELGLNNPARPEIQEVTNLRSEFHNRYAANEYAAAVDVLKRLKTPLFAEGRYEELAQYYEQLTGKLEGVDLVRHQLDMLALINHRLGKLNRAVAYYEEGLKRVREQGNQIEECRYLVNLAICKQESGDLVGTTLYCRAALNLAGRTEDYAYAAHIWNIIGDSLASLGEISDAMQASECALERAHDTFQWAIEVGARINLGQHYEALGKDHEADGECKRACNMAESNGFQLEESAARRNLGVLEVNRGKYKSAIRDLTKAKELADLTKNVQLQQTTRIELATALLRDNNLNEAETIVGEAIGYATPLFSPEARALRGVILQRQGKPSEAGESFHDALEQAEEVLKRIARYYRVLDVMGLSYSGLTLSEATDEYLDEAIGAYMASLLIANEPGIVRRRLLLFDALAKVDWGGGLTSIRNAIVPLADKQQSS